MNYLIEIIVMMTLLEIFEANWQRAETIEGILLKSYYLYKKNIFLFFLMHPTFYFVLFVSLYTDILNFGIVAILTFKVLDFMFKLDIIDKYFIKNNLDYPLKELLKTKTNPWYFLMGLSIYVPTLFYSLT